MKRYWILPVILLVIGGAGFLLWAHSGHDHTDYPEAKEYAPNLWFDSKEKYYPTDPLEFYYDANGNELAGAAAVSNYDKLSLEEKLSKVKIFYKADDLGSEIVYQYWLFYVMNNAKNGHYGDWESVFVFVDKESGNISKAVGSAHGSGNKLNNPDNKNIWVYVGNGSHANCPVEASDNTCGSSYWVAWEEWDSKGKIIDPSGFKIITLDQYYTDSLGGSISFSRDKSPTLGVNPYKVFKLDKLPFSKTKSEIYINPPIIGEYVGKTPTFAWAKEEYNNPQKILVPAHAKIANSVGGFFNDAGNFLAAVGKTVTAPFVNFFETTSDSLSELTADVRGFTPAGGETPAPTRTPTAAPTPTSAPPIIARGLTPPLGGQTPTPSEPETEVAFVSRVIDGDTVELASGQKLRYIGVNTPELPDECFAEQATGKNRELVENKQVLLIKGPDDVDNYGRLLRFVWQDSNFINRTLVEGGYAYANNFGREHVYDQVLENAEAKAKRERAGLWGEACLPSPQKIITEQKPTIRMYESPNSRAPLTGAPVVSIPDNTTFNSYSDINSGLDGYQISLYGTAKPSSLVTIFQNPTYTATTTKEGNWSKEVTLTNEGANVFSITAIATDATENTSNPTSIVLNLDSISPTSRISVSNYAIDSDQFKINWGTDSQDIAYYEVEYKIGNSGAWQDWGSATTTTTSKNYLNATTNTYYFRVRGTDIHQNTGAWQESQAVVIDLYLVVINEIQINDAEFVELYNPTSNQINLNGYYFSYYSSTKTSWLDPWRNQPFQNNAKISANGYFLIGLKDYPASSGNPNADWQPYASAQLSNSEGTVAIFPFDPTTATTSQFAYENRVDAIGWGSGISLYEGALATTTPAAGQSLTRNSSHTDTENNSVDFVVATSTTPTNSAGETYIPPPPPSNPIWAMYQKDARHSGLATLSGPTWTNSSQATTTWIFDIAGSGGRSQPVVDASSTAYATNAMGEVYAINSNGTQKWKFDPRTVPTVGDGWADASPALSSDGSRVYSVYTDNAKKKLRLFSIKTSDGSMDWKYAPSENGYNQTITSPIIDESGNIYIAGNYNLYSISSSGNLNSGWPKNLSPSGLGLKMPAVSKENGIEYVYISGIVSNNAGDRYIWKLRASDGSEEWKQNPIGNNSLSNPVSVNASSTIYTGGTSDLRLYSVSPTDGSKNWDSVLNSGNVSGAVPSFDASGNIYVGTRDLFDTGKLHKINATGTLAWSSDAFYSAVQHPAVIDSQGRIYVGAKDRFVYALNSNDGSLIWKYGLSSEPRGFAIGNGRVYVVGYDGKVYSFGQ